MSLPGGRQHRRRRAGLLAGALALLLQTLAWAWLPAMAAAPAGAKPGTFVVPICTPTGIEYRRIAVGPEQPDAPDGTAKVSVTCPLCPLMAGLALPPPDRTLLPPAEIARHSSTALPGARIVTGWFLSTLKARAPPAAA